MLKTKKVEFIPLTIEQVDATDVGSIVPFLINRYVYIRMKRAGALAEYFVAFRAEFGLPAQVPKVLAQDIISAFYQDGTRSSDRVREEWRECLRDLAARGSDTTR